MALGFDARLKKELRRRDAAVLQMKLAGDATSSIFSQKVDELKGDLKTQMAPENIISQHPWTSMLVGVLAGAVSMIFLKSKFFPAPQQLAIVRGGIPAPQKVVVEVVGATQQKPASPWKPILDAVMAGAPAVAAYAQQFMQGAHENGHGTAEVGAQQAPQAVEQQSTPGSKPQGGSFPASISRRTAPPPRENS